ncbi:uncharacterized protein LOC134701016 [Mytilus trossulus]|uniref:uncharacterized protein LOC134701016 n=1 Tax=Mytilus trossulus TaxID=6551 RepID=UPI003007E867
MAQVLAVPGDVRHEFAFRTSFNHDFGRITGIAATTKGNIVLCDYDKKNLILLDPFGTYLNKLEMESQPYDVVITSQNIGYVTQPNTRSVVQIDPDRLIVLHNATSNNKCTSVICAAAVQNSGRDIESKVPCYLAVNVCGSMFAYPVKNYKIILNENSGHIFSLTGHPIDPRVFKFHAVENGLFFSCISGQNYIKVTNCALQGLDGYEQNAKIGTMDTPTDICSDDNGHIYVSGRDSNNIHRLTQDGKVLDIPLDIRHGISQPVALCFNQNYDKLYIATNGGTQVAILNVI